MAMQVACASIPELETQRSRNESKDDTPYDW